MTPRIAPEISHDWQSSAECSDPGAADLPITPLSPGEIPWIAAARRDVARIGTGASEILVRYLDRLLADAVGSTSVADDMAADVVSPKHSDRLRVLRFALSRTPRPDADDDSAWADRARTLSDIAEDAVSLSESMTVVVAAVLRWYDAQSRTPQRDVRRADDELSCVVRAAVHGSRSAFDPARARGTTHR